MNRNEALDLLVNALDEWPTVLEGPPDIDVGEWSWKISKGKCLYVYRYCSDDILRGDWLCAKAESRMHDEDQSVENSGDSGAHYRYEYKGVKLDPYRILDVYGIKHPSHQHAIKKLLRAGDSLKGKEQDIKEVIDTLNRWLEMLAEDNEVGDE